MSAGSKASKTYDLPGDGTAVAWYWHTESKDVGCVGWAWLGEWPRRRGGVTAGACVVPAPAPRVYMLSARSFPPSVWMLCPNVVRLSQGCAGPTAACRRKALSPLLSILLPLLLLLLLLLLPTLCRYSASFVPSGGAKGSATVLVPEALGEKGKNVFRAPSAGTLTLTFNNGHSWLRCARLRTLRRRRHDHRSHGASRAHPRLVLLHPCNVIGPALVPCWAS